MNRVISVKPLHNYMLEITFSDGLIKIIDVAPFIGGGISDLLKEETYFHQVTNEEGGGIRWPNGYDFCPNFLRDEMPAASPVEA
jgi:hypothetical protein